MQRRGAFMIIHDILGVLGIGTKQLIADGVKTVGRVTAVDVCRVIKVNKKAMRMNAMDGSVFPHIISFVYAVDGREYTGKHYVNWDMRCPSEGEKIVVYYDRSNPASYAVNL